MIADSPQLSKSRLLPLSTEAALLETSFGGAHFLSRLVCDNPQVLAWAGAEPIPVFIEQHMSALCYRKIFNGKIIAFCWAAQMNSYAVLLEICWFLGLDYIELRLRLILRFCSMSACCQVKSKKITYIWIKERTDYDELWAQKFRRFSLCRTQNNMISLLLTQDANSRA